MHVRSFQIYRMIIYLMVLYILDKNLFDFLSFGTTKLLYYAVVAFFGLFGIIKGIQTKKYRKITIWFLIYCLFVLFNGFLTFDSERFSFGLIEYLTYPLVFFSFLFLFKGFREPVHYKKLVNLLFVWSSITSVLALFEYIAKRPIILSDNITIYDFLDGSSAYRAGVFIGSPMILAIVLGMITLIMLYVYKVNKEKRLMKYIILNFLGILATCSRGPLLFTIMAIMAMYLCFFKKKIIGKKTFGKVFLLGTLLLIFIVVFVFFDVKTGIDGIDTIIKRFGNTFNSKESGNTARIMIWTYYLNEFIVSPYIGRGIAITSNLVTNNLSHFNGLFTIAVAESGLLTRLVETGLIGTVLYYVFIIKCAKNSFKRKVYANNRLLNLNNILVIGVLIIFFLEDIILQISTDIFANFIVLMILVTIASINERTNICGEKR